MSYLLAETGGLLLASMILGCALGYLIGVLRRSKAADAGTASAPPTNIGHSIDADERSVYEDNLRRARSEIVRLEKQNNRMTSALEASRPVSASVGAAPGIDRWDAASSDIDRSGLAGNGIDTAQSDGELAEREAELTQLRERNEQVEDALAIREHEIEELEESVRVMHQRVIEAEHREDHIEAGAPLFGAAAVATTVDADHGDADQLRTELEQARSRLIRLDERQLQLDQTITRLRGPAARAERLEAETARLRDRLRLREARLRELEKGLTGSGANAAETSRVRSAPRRGGRRVRASNAEQKVGGGRSVATSRDRTDATVGDLTRIDGIGPVLARMLHQRGVSSLSDLAELNEVDISRLESELPEFATRIRRDRWVEQAQQMLSKRNTR